MPSAFLNPFLPVGVGSGTGLDDSGIARAGACFRSTDSGPYATQKGLGACPRDSSIRRALVGTPVIIVEYKSDHDNETDKQ